MSSEWEARASGLTERPLVGTGAFRLMPDDEMVTGPASGQVTCFAQGWATAISYRWRHPQDAEQEGVLVVASPEDDGRVQATLVDSWHQKPGPMHLAGVREGAVVRLHAAYLETWGWNIEVELGESGVRLCMQNVVPEEGRSMLPEDSEFSGGPYDVMDVRLSA